MPSRFTVAPLAFIAVLMASAAEAHTGAGATAGFAAGAAHPVFGLDHTLAMVALGMWAALMGGRATWTMPTAFVGGMALGGAVGMAGWPLPLVEVGIAMSVVVLGLLIATRNRVPLALGALVTVLFAAFHGHAHGAEMPLGGDAFTYAAGFILVTAALHIGGIGLGRLALAARWPTLVPVSGGALAGMGVMMLIG